MFDGTSQWMSTFFLGLGQELQSIEEVEVIWVSGKMFVLVKNGLSRSIDDSKFDELAVLPDAKTPKLRCLLRLKINKKYRDSFGEFIIKIISPNKKMCWDYSLNSEAYDVGETIEHSYSGDNLTWSIGLINKETISPTKLNIKYK